MFPPSRIVCLTEETVETLYLLGEQDRIVGISGYVVRPPQARREKPRVSAFTSANIDKILALKPDRVLTFSDLQADIAADLVRRGLEVLACNQRSVGGILDMIQTVGAMVDASERARQLVSTLETRLADVRSRAERLPKRPKVFFEECDDPLISGIGWVSELVEIAGGIDIFADRAGHAAAKDRVVTIDKVVAREPDLIIGSWCGKKFPQPGDQRPDSLEGADPMKHYMFWRADGWWPVDWAPTASPDGGKVDGGRARLGLISPFPTAMPSSRLSAMRWARSRK